VKIELIGETATQLALCYVEVHEKVRCTQLISGDVYNVDNSHITASSTWPIDSTHYLGTNRSRLDTTGESDHETLKGGSWTAAVEHDNQWIQAEFSKVMTVSGVVTQGRFDEDQWVESYKFFYGDTEDKLEEYEEILPGNEDRNRHVINLIEPPVNARFVRINPQAWKDHVSLRFDVIGCNSSEYDNSAGPILTVQCPVLPEPPIGHTRITQLDGWHNGAIVKYECLPGNFYYSGEFTKKCEIHDSAGSGEWIGDDLKCRGCCDFERTSKTIIVYNFNTQAPFE
ncbi:unnamed protein product, partial [Owenia fusiformis]